MKHSPTGRRGLLIGFLVAMVASGFGTVPVVRADAISDAATQRAANYALDPPLGIAGAAPLVMLNLSRDHQLFYKAYNDFTDLDGDQVLDTTYKNSLTYAGYFDPKRCYTYDAGNGYFTPGNAVDSTNYCSKQWSGNFLNWVSMTRMDEVRKILYGGLRSTDTTSNTVLERAFLPADAHSYAKYYNGADIAKLTPYDPATAAPSTGAMSPSSLTSSNGSTAADGNYGNVSIWSLQLSVGSKLTASVGDQIKVVTSDNQTILAPVRFERQLQDNVTHRKQHGDVDQRGRDDEHGLYGRQMRHHDRDPAQRLDLDGVQHEPAGHLVLQLVARAQWQSVVADIQCESSDPHGVRRLCAMGFQ